MYIQKIDIENFRLLHNVSLLLEESATVIVGRNNSGKTAVTELFRRLLSDTQPTFRLEDFSLCTHDKFWSAFKLAKEKKSNLEIRNCLPMIKVSITVKYDKTESDLGALTDFIVDVDDERTDALIVAQYEVESGKLTSLFNEICSDSDATDNVKKLEFFRAMRERIPSHFKTSVIAVDPGDHTNTKSMTWTSMKTLLQSGFISAQRGLDDATHRDNDVLGKVFEAIFNIATRELSDPKDKNSVKTLEDAVLGTQRELDRHFNDQLSILLPAFSLFGYPGLPDPELRTETTLDVDRILKNHTKISYAGVNGVHLPEGYNGLGARNLILILLRLLEFFKAYKAMQGESGIHLIFIEEPEAHLHPQMQEVFISKLSEIATMFASHYNNGLPWPVQFIVTTHSSHLANRAPFSAIRYFLASPVSVGSPTSTTCIKDLRKGFGEGQKERDNEKWLHQYMTLTRCDLLFADKVILIEGTSERLLLPRMIEKIDNGLSGDNKLSSQYVSILEVGGAYAHKFSKLLDFLDLPSLIITDLDSIDIGDRRKACPVSKGSGTSNATIHDWFDNSITPTALIAKPDEAKIVLRRRIAYEVPETVGQPCGRSFEGAFMLANPEKFNLSGTDFTVIEDEIWSKVSELKKSEFALTYAIELTEWNVPRYISEGLQWLSSQPKSKTPTVQTEVVGSDGFGGDEVADGEQRV